MNAAMNKIAYMLEVEGKKISEVSDELMIPVGAIKRVYDLLYFEVSPTTTSKIRRAIANGDSIAVITKDFGVSVHMVDKIKDSIAPHKPHPSTGKCLDRLISVETVKYVLDNIDCKDKKILSKAPIGATALQRIRHLLFLWANNRIDEMFIDSYDISIPLYRTFMTALDASKELYSTAEVFKEPYTTSDIPTRTVLSDNNIRVDELLHIHSNDFEADVAKDGFCQLHTHRYGCIDIEIPTDSLPFLEAAFRAIQNKLYEYWRNENAERMAGE